MKFRVTKEEFYNYFKVISIKGDFGRNYIHPADLPNVIELEGIPVEEKEVCCLDCCRACEAMFPVSKCSVHRTCDGIEEIDISNFQGHQPVTDEDDKIPYDDIDSLGKKLNQIIRHLKKC